MTFNLSIFFMTLMLATGCGKKVKENPATPEVITPAITADRYLDLVNDYRKSIGLRAFDKAEVIEEESYEHARAMASHKRGFGHYGKALRCRKIKEEFGVGNLCDESIALGPSTAQALFNLFIKSEPDRLRLEDEQFTHTGVGLEKDELGNVYWTQMFYAVP